MKLEYDNKYLDLYSDIIYILCDLVALLRNSPSESIIISRAKISDIPFVITEEEMNRILDSSPKIVNELSYEHYLTLHRKIKEHCNFLIKLKGIEYLGRNLREDEKFI